MLAPVEEPNTSFELAPKAPDGVAEGPAGTVATSIPSNAANGSAADTGSGFAGSGTKLLPLDARGLNALKGSVTLGNAPELERTAVAEENSPKPPVDAPLELPPNASKGEVDGFVAAAGATNASKEDAEDAPNASNAGGLFVFFTGLPNASNT